MSNQAERDACLNRDAFLQCPVSRTTCVRLVFTSSPTNADIDRLIKVLEVLRPADESLTARLEETDNQ